MKDFTFYNPTKIVFGKNALDSLEDLLKQSNYKKILITFGKGSLKDSKLYKNTIEKLKDFTVKEFWGIDPNPRVETIRKAVLIAKEFHPDLILAIGGGSVIDGSKLLAASMNSEIDPWEIVLDSSKATVITPLAVILTVAATGSEMNNGAVITNWSKNEKKPFRHQDTYPKFSILNPENTYSLTKEQTAYGIVDIYSHVCEQYFHTTIDAPLQDRFSESILTTLIEYGPKLLNNLNTYEYREAIMWSGTLALNRLIGAGVNQDWATHAIEHEISAFYDIPHGAGLAIITPRWMKEVIEQKKVKFIQYGKRIWNLSGTDDEIITAAISKTYDFFKSFGIKMNLTEWGITSKNFPIMIDRLTKAKIGEFPLEELQILNILNNCLIN